MSALGQAPAPRLRRPVVAVAAVSLLALFLAVGGLGAYRYGWNYWLYRGFSPPREAAFVVERGHTESFYVTSPALGGRRQHVLVYLPPGYDERPQLRYPVAYLLHGVPGRPAAFLLTVRAGVLEDALVARQRARPLILVMPFGSSSQFTDKEWANGIRPHEAWETFVARDLVGTIDARYRTIPTARGRALMGLSEGGYGALNIGLHHPHEFGVLESWSGYELADDLRSIFGRDPRRLAANSPLDTLGRAAPVLRRVGTYVWFYSGTEDPLRRQNAEFARSLAREGIPHRYFLVRGGHNWAVWRAEAEEALVAASQHLAHA